MRTRLQSHSASIAAALLAAIGALSTGPAAAQQSVLASGLETPTKIVLTQGGKLLVSEAGLLPAAPPDPAPFVVNQGRVSVVERDGSHTALLEGLPSGLDLDEVAPTGPSGLFVSGAQTLYLEIGQGDSIRRIAGGETPNPAGLSSALLSSLFKIHFSTAIDLLGEGFALDPATDYRTLADGDRVELVNSLGQHAWVSVLADFRDLYPAAGPPNVVSGSNPFGLTRIGNDLYLPDAGQNSLVRVDRATGRTRTITHFPPVPNPAPFGPPVSQAVPNSVRRLPGKPTLLVTLLTGFPFNTGVASVQRVDAQTGTAQPFISGLTTAIDVLALGGNGPFLVLEFASGFSPATGFVPPGRLLRFDTEDAAPAVLSDALVTPTSMAVDESTGELFVTEIFTGRIIRIEL